MTQTKLAAGGLMRTARNAAATAAFAATLAVSAVAPSAAQNMFAPAAYVNDQVVTRYEVDQRVALTAALGQPVSPNDALEALIEDRIKVETARRAGVAPTQEQLAASISEFASRGSLDTEAFLNMITSRGVAEETFRDFVYAGLAWRDYAQQRFGNRVNVTDGDVDRALQQSGPSGNLRVQMAEIFLPARTPQERAQSLNLAEQISAQGTFAAFSEAARRFSVAPSRETGGLVDWLPVSNLPGPLRTSVLDLKPGQVTSPLSTENAIGIFQLRQIAEIEAPQRIPNAIEYATYLIPGGRTQEALARAATLRAETDTCMDLYGVAKDQPENVLTVQSLPAAQIPSDIAYELAKLDPGESSVALTRNGGNTLVFLMLCGRDYGVSADENAREQIRMQLRNAQLARLAEAHLSELVADSNIVQR